MSQENQAPLEAEEVVPTTPDDNPQAEEKSAEEESTQSLQAQLQKEREAREKAEKAAADLAFKKRDRKRQVEEVEEVESGDEDRPITHRQLEDILAKQRDQERKALMSDRIDQLADTIAETGTEKELIVEMHKNRAFPSHLSLKEQLEECYIIANKKKILGQNAELKRALKGKGGVTSDGSSTHQDPPASSAPKLAAGDSAELARVGFHWNASTKRFEKKLPNGSLLVKDKGSSNTRVVRA